MERRAWIPITALAALVLLTGCGKAILGASATEEVEKTIPLAAGGKFSLENVNGTVTVTVGEPGVVTVVARKEIRALDESKAKQALPELKVEVSQNGDEVSIETVYPKASRSLFGAGLSMSVQYDVKVPRGTEVDLTTLNGNVNVDLPGSKASCETTNGSVKVESAQLLSAASVNGKITFKAEDLEDVSGTNGSISGAITSLRPRRARVETVNGSVDLTLPRAASFRMEAENVNGAIQCDFSGPGGSKHEITGDVNGGGESVSVSTVNGSVRVRAAA